jgi:hypothetical protein
MKVGRSIVFENLTAMISKRTVKKQVEISCRDQMVLLQTVCALQTLVALIFELLG